MKVNRKVVKPEMSGLELIRNAQVFLPVRSVPMLLFLMIIRLMLTLVLIFFKFEGDNYDNNSLSDVS